MPCYHPLSLARPKRKRGVLIVPCGQCIGCRLERSRQWAARCMCEAQMHEDNSFITLTYRDSCLPWGSLAATLVPRDLELFWKRLRKEFGNGIRYYACGEYGERTRRPHYHACIFGFDFPDKVVHSSRDGQVYYSSDSLDRLWGYGNCIIGDVTFESAAYVARYVTSKLTGPKASFYSDQGIEPEFGRMSRRPGIGSSWFDKFRTDIFPRGRMVVRGVFTRPPRYFVTKLERIDKLEFEIQAVRRRYAGELKYWKDRDLGAASLVVRERVKLAQISRLVRNEL